MPTGRMHRHEAGAPLRPLPAALRVKVPPCLALRAGRGRRRSVADRAAQDAELDQDPDADASISETEHQSRHSASRIARSTPISDSSDYRMLMPMTISGKRPAWRGPGSASPSAHRRDRRSTSWTMNCDQPCGEASQPKIRDRLTMTTTHAPIQNSTADRPVKIDDSCSKPDWICARRSPMRPLRLIAAMLIDPRRARQQPKRSRPSACLRCRRGLELTSTANALTLQSRRMSTTVRIRRR